MGGGDFWGKGRFDPGRGHDAVQREGGGAGFAVADHVVEEVDRGAGDFGAVLADPGGEIGNEVFTSHEVGVEADRAHVAGDVHAQFARVRRH